MITFSSGLDIQRLRKATLRVSVNTKPTSNPRLKFDVASNVQSSLGKTFEKNAPILDKDCCGDA